MPSEKHDDMHKKTETRREHEMRGMCKIGRGKMRSRRKATKKRREREQDRGRGYSLNRYVFTLL